MHLEDFKYFEQGYCITYTKDKLTHSSREFSISLKPE